MEPEPTIRVREATESDGERIGELIKQLRSQGETMPERAPSATYVTSYLSSTTDVVLVAEREDVVVGLLTMSVTRDLYHEGPCAHVRELVVDEAVRGRGVGGMLLDAAIQGARALGCAEISLSTGSDNGPAKELYRSRGLTMEALHLEMHFDAQP